MFRVNPTLDYKCAEPLDMARQPAASRGGSSLVLMMSVPVMMWGAGCDFSQICFGAAGVLGSISAVAFWKLRQPTPPQPPHPVSETMRLNMALVAYQAAGVLAQGDFDEVPAESPSGHVVEMVNLGGNVYACPEDLVYADMNRQSGIPSLALGVTTSKIRLLPGKN